MPTQQIKTAGLKTANSNSNTSANNGSSKSKVRERYNTSIQNIEVENFVRDLYKKYGDGYRIKEYCRAIEQHTKKFTTYGTVRNLLLRFEIKKNKLQKNQTSCATCNQKIAVENEL